MAPHLLPGRKPIGRTLRRSLARKMLASELSSELKEMNARFDALRSGLEGMAGSPGEWMVERMDELETELKRRKGLR